MNKTFGATLLIAGCSVGAGMLGLPIMVGPGGFFPSCVWLILVYVFMALTGVVLAEVVLSFDKDYVNLLTLSQRTCGSTVRALVALLFTFLFYGIMIAYITGSSYLIMDFFDKAVGVAVSFAAASTAITILMYVVITQGVTLVDQGNRWCVLGLIICYVLLVIYSLPYVQPKSLMRSDWSVSVIALPILIISFGYHNLIASLCRYLERKKSALIKAIVVGSSIPLCAYVVWNLVILGIVPYTNAEEWKAAQMQGEMVSQVLSSTVGIESIVDIAKGFTFFAIVTSFLPVAFSFLDFAGDALPSVHKRALGLIVLVPPYVVSLIDHHLFLEALNYSGGFCAVVLFGILPAVMALVRKKQIPEKAVESFVFARTPLLILLILCACAIIGVEFLFEMGRI